MGRTQSWIRKAVLLLTAAWLVRVILAADRYLSIGTGRHNIESAIYVLLLLCVAIVALNRTRAADGQVHTDARRHGIVSTDALAWSLTAFATLAMLARAVHIGPLADDFVLITLARSGAYFSTTWEFVRPVPLLFWRLLWSVGQSWTLIHTVNIVLHLVNCLLVWLLARGVMPDGTSAVRTAALFVCSPLVVEPVIWASGAQELLMAMFVLAACVTSIGPATRTHYFASPLFIVLAVGSKETAAIAPLLIGCVQALRRTTREQLLRRWVIALTTTALVVWIRLSIRPTLLDNTVRTRYQLKELVGRPFAALALPAHRDYIGAHNIAFLIWIAVLGALLIVWSASRKADQELRLMVTSVIWVIAPVLPLQRFFFISDDLQGSRYLYLSAVGWAAIIALLSKSVETRYAKVASASLAVVIVAAQLWLFSINTQPWFAAASVRDQVLEQAHSTLATADCGTPVFENLPDNVNGAYVFRNGFQEAIAPWLIRRQPPPWLKACSFEWDGHSFRRRF